jgi:hypothetical protein
MSAESRTIETQPVGHHGHGLPEPPAVDARHLLWLAGAALLLLSGAIFGLGAIYWREVPIKNMPLPQIFPQPRVQPDEAAELRRLLEKQRRELAAYHWANKEHTLMQIPIERAMQIIVQKGAEAYGPIANFPDAVSSPEAGAERAITPSIGQANGQRDAPPSPSPNNPSNVPESSAKTDHAP